MKYFSPSVLDGSITTAKIAAGAVTNAKLANAAVTGSKIQLSAVDSTRLAAQAVTQGKIDTSATSTSGSVGAGNQVDITLTHDCFWPMIHTTGLTAVKLGGHATDVGGADNPRLSLHGGIAGQTYDIDYRNINA